MSSGPDALDPEQRRATSKKVFFWTFVSAFAFFAGAAAWLLWPRPDPLAEWKARTAALPDLAPVPRGTAHELAVVYLEDPRLPGLASDEREALYAKVSALLKSWYGYEVRLKETRTGTPAAEFKRARPFLDTPAVVKMRRALRLEMKDPGAAIVLRLLARGEIDQRGLAAVRAYFPGLPDDPDKAAGAVAAAFMERYKALASLQAKDKTPLLGAGGAETLSYLGWSALLADAPDADFYLVNGTMLEADLSMPLYVLARGGLTTGLVENNPRRPLGGAGVVGLLPFLHPVLAANIPDSERLDTIATFWMHELGHLFLRAEELYDEPGCVHAAPKGLDYHAYHKAVRAAGNRCSRPPKALEKF